MAATAVLPTYSQAVVGSNGLATPAFYRFFAALGDASTQSSGLQSQIDALAQDVAGIGAGFQVRGQQSIVQSGASVPGGVIVLSLANDVPIAGNTQYYGSDQSGNKGWYPVASALAGSANVDLATASNGVTTFDLSKPVNSGAGTLQAVTVDVFGRITGTRAATITGTAGRVTVANGDASAGLPTLDLATVADAGGGALLRFVRDAWGRISGTSAATTADLTEGSNLYFTAARVLATVLAGLSTATNAVITATDTVLSALGKLQAQITDNLLPPGCIDGLKMVWVNGTALTVTTGAAYIPNPGEVLRATANIAKTGLTLTASTWYHVYLYNNAGTPDIEISTTAPDAPYNGTARAKTGDTSRRYVGSIKTDASGNIYNFLHDARASRVYYQTSVYLAPFQVINGSASTPSNVSCNAVVPVTGITAMMTYANNDVAITVLVGNSISPPSSTPISFLSQVGKNLSSEGELQLDGNQAFEYMFLSTATSNFVARVKGYEFER